MAHIDRPNPIFVEPNAPGRLQTTIFVYPKSADGLNSREVRLFTTPAGRQLAPDSRMAVVLPQIGLQTLKMRMLVFAVPRCSLPLL